MTSHIQTNSHTNCKIKPLHNINDERIVNIDLETSGLYLYERLIEKAFKRQIQNNGFIDRIMLINQKNHQFTIM